MNVLSLNVSKHGTRQETPELPAVRLRLRNDAG